MAWSKEADEAARADMKAAADRQEREAAERERAEAEARGEVDARKIVDDMAVFNGGTPYVDPVKEIVARVEAEGDES
jgi:hypothetical protein